MKRIVTLILEYDCGDKQSLWTIGITLRRLIEEDMPYVKIVNITNAPGEKETK